MTTQGVCRRFSPVYPSRQRMVQRRRNSSGLQRWRSGTWVIRVSRSGTAYADCLPRSTQGEQTYRRFYRQSAFPAMTISNLQRREAPKYLQSLLILALKRLRSSTRAVNSQPLQMWNVHGAQCLLVSFSSSMLLEVRLLPCST